MNFKIGFWTLNCRDRFDFPCVHANDTAPQNSEIHDNISQKNVCFNLCTHRLLHWKVADQRSEFQARKALEIVKKYIDKNLENVLFNERKMFYD